MKNALFTFLGLLTFSASLSILFMVMRAVMAVGGFCAEGGPYQIAVHCPGGTAYLAPLSVWIMIAGAAIYFIYSLKIENSPRWGTLFWSALFMSLGWNFLEFSLNPPFGEGIAIGWLICGIMFEIMGVFPLFALNSSYAAATMGKSEPELKQILLGKAPNTTGHAHPVKFYEGQYFLLFLHVAAVAMGIYAGLQIFLNS